MHGEGRGAAERKCERGQYWGGDALVNLLHEIICFDSAMDRKGFIQRFGYRGIIVGSYNGCNTDGDDSDGANARGRRGARHHRNNNDESKKWT
jgi:hypothetical protein